MIQLNLLPDVKLEYVKAQRLKHLVMVVSIIVASVAVTLVLILFLGVQVQKRHLSNLDGDITSMSNDLKNEPDLNKILTVQNQLNSLNELHDNKPAAQRLGSYLSQITPNEVSIAELKVDFTLNTMSFTGDARSLKAVNEFVDTLKFTDYSAGETKNKAFSSVVLASFTRNDENTRGNQPVSYEVTLSYDPIIFQTTQRVNLRVPKTITTRSNTERPTELFQQQPETNQEGGQ